MFSYPADPISFRSPPYKGFFPTPITALPGFPGLRIEFFTAPVAPPTCFLLLVSYYLMVRVLDRRSGRVSPGVRPWKTPRNHKGLWKRLSQGSYEGLLQSLAERRIVPRTERRSCATLSYVTSVRGGICGADGSRTNAPVFSCRWPRSMRYSRPGHAVLIFFNSRRQSARK